MIATIARLIGMRVKPRAHARKTASLKELVCIRSAMLTCIDDCEGPSSQRLRNKISHAQTPQELWLLRNDAYQMISQRHNQTVAAERINNLMASFEGWLEPKQLIRIK